LISIYAFFEQESTGWYKVTKNMWPEYWILLLVLSDYATFFSSLCASGLLLYLQLIPHQLRAIPDSVLLWQWVCRVIHSSIWWATRMQLME